MNKWRTALLSLALIAAANLQPAQHTLAEGRAAEQGVAIGAVVGSVLATDIRAYVSGAEIPSMNIDGYTAVAAEDLRRYGFDVEWRPAERKLVVLPRKGKPLDPLPPEAAEGKRAPVGTKIADVLYTDIAAYYGETKIPSYNIGGRTAIVLNDLQPFGAVVWNEQERRLDYAPSDAQAAADPPETRAPLVLTQTAMTEIGPVTVKDGTIVLDGQSIGRIVAQSQPMMSVRAFAQRLGYHIEEDAATGQLTFDDSTYRIRLVPGERGPQLAWMGGNAGEHDWTAEPIRGNGDWLVHEQDVRALFGCGPNPGWTWGTPAETYRCATYQVRDLGVAATAPSMRYEVSAAVYADDRVTAYPSVMLDNRIHGSATHDGRMYFRTTEEKTGSLTRHESVADVPLDWDDNEMTLQVNDGWRVLFMKRFVLRPDAAATSPVIDYGGGIVRGAHTSIELDAGSAIYSRTGDASFAVSGTVKQAAGDELVFVAEKRNAEGGYRKVWENKLPLPADRFARTLPLPSGTGLYRIRVLSWEYAGPVRNYLDIAKLYVDKTDGDPIPPPVDAASYVPPAEVPAKELMGSWMFDRYKESFVGYRGYPFALAIGGYDWNSPEGYWLGTPAPIAVSIANMGETTLTLNHPVTFDVEIADPADGKWIPLWRGRLPALDHSFAPLEYATFSLNWDQRDADGNQLPPGHYIARIKLPVEIDYTAEGRAESETEIASDSIRTKFPITVEWPQ